MANKEELSKQCHQVDTQLKHFVLKTFRPKHARLKALKQSKLYKTAVKLNTRHGIKKNNHNFGKTCGKVSSTNSADKCTLSTIQCNDIAQSGVVKKKFTKVHKQHGLKTPESETRSPGSRKVFAVNYQELVQQAMEKSVQGEEVALLSNDGSFESDYQHLVTSALCSKETVTNKTKHVNKGAHITSENVVSMFKHGFNNTDVTQTPNDKSHILQYTDVGTNKSIAEFSKCGLSGPAFHETEGDLNIDTEYIEESCGSKTTCSTQNILHGNALEDVQEEMGIMPPLVAFYGVSKSSYVIVLKHPRTLFLEGELKICVLNGSLRVLGHILMGASCEKSIIYSPAEYCKLSLKTVDTGTSSDLTNLQSILVSLGLSSQKVEDIIIGLNMNDCVALIERTSSPLATYLTSQSPTYSILSRFTGPRRTSQFYEQEKVLQCTFDFEGTMLTNCLVEPIEWDHIANCIAERNLKNDCTRVMICGGKSVGKSTLLRFLINQSLSRVKEVLCLDFDPGQAEFTVPGSVSVVRVSKPLLGPNFTHILYPERMVYIGDVDMSKCPGQYIKSAQHIIEYCLEQPEFSKMLWFINTMGFCKGVGVDLTTNLIKLLNPTNVVQIQSKSRYRNYPELLSPEYVLNRKSPLQHLLASVHRHLNYALHIIPSAAEGKHTDQVSECGLSSKMTRNIMLLAYFKSVLNSPRLPLLDIIPYKISLSQLILGICHETVNYSELLCVINANLVALCIVPDDEYVLHPEKAEFPKVLTQPQGAHCIGYGIVRGIDLKEKLLYLITPLPEEQLKDVNCLLVGSVTLPPNMYMHSNTGLGHIPYVTLASGQATSNRRTRRCIPPARQRTQYAYQR